MIVHRDYTIAKPSQINVLPNRSVRFVNPAAQSPTAATRLKLEADGTFQPVPQFSDLRNRALCDVFFGISAMERAGTGLTDTRELAEQQGGTATFAYPPGQDCFAAELFRLAASAGSATVARDTRPVGTYVLNLLPFASIPQALTHISLNVAGWDELKANVQIDDAGTFVFESKTGDLWSFVPAPLLSTLFAPVAKSPARPIPLEEVERDPVLRAKFSWLMRRHFERYLSRFADRGLVIEKNKRGYPAKRAYFTAFKGNNRTIVYDTPHRKNVRRDVVKRRGEDKKTWFECEGFRLRSCATGGHLGRPDQAVLHVREARRRHAAAGLHAHQQGDPPNQVRSQRERRERSGVSGRASSRRERRRSTLATVTLTICCSKAASSPSMFRKEV